MTEQPHNRIDLAVEQLDVALCLFLEKNSYVSALTLAGAAEEIFGKALSHQKKQTVLQYKYEVVEPVHKLLYRKPLPWTEYIADENRARNAAKHMATPNDSLLIIDLEGAALWMLVRACHNFDRLDLPRTARMIEFENWFYEHVVGV